MISTISDIDLTWLQLALDKRFGEKAQRLTNFSVSDSTSTNATIAIIYLNYESNISGECPNSLFLKLCKGGNHFIKGSEYFYYARDYFDLKNSPLPICYDAQFSESNGDYSLLLEDLSQTHFSNKEVKPSRLHARTVATELARLHSFRWGTRTKDVESEMDSTLQISRYIDHVKKGVEPVLKAIEVDTPHQWTQTVRFIFEKHPNLMKDRALDLRGHTFIHGDPNPSNILSPHQEPGKTYIIDRQPFNWSLRFWLGVSDLVYMAVPYWEPEIRRSLEKEMLEQYHKALTEFGVFDYSWEQCQADYRLCLAHGIYVAISWGVDNKSMSEMQWLWKAQLRRSIAALEDWNW